MNNSKDQFQIAEELPWRNLNTKTQSEQMAVFEENLEVIKARAAFNDVAMLDAKMMYVIVSKLELEELSAQYRNAIIEGLKFMQRPPIAQLTYADIILTNPTDQMRTFTQGKTGESEASFYRGHQVIEGHLNDIIENLRYANNTGDADFIVYASQSLSEAKQAMEKIGNDLDVSDYKEFRRYFDPNPYTGEKGPSGLFSTRIPHIDILLGGWQGYKGKDFLADNAGYFPQRDMFKLRESLNENVNLSERFASDSFAKSQLNTIRNWMEKFREAHKGSMRHRIAKTIA